MKVIVMSFLLMMNTCLYALEQKQSMPSASVWQHYAQHKSMSKSEIQQLFLDDIKKNFHENQYVPQNTRIFLELLPLIFECGPLFLIN